MKNKLLFAIISLIPVISGAASIKSYVPDLASDDFEVRQESRNAILKTFSEACAPGVIITERAELEVEVMDLMEAELPLSERLYLIRMLELFGTGRSVDVLSSLLGDKEPAIGDAARRALAAIPGKSSLNSLLAGLVSKDADEVIASIDALVYRGNPSVALDIARLLEWKDMKVVKAAAVALGKLRNDEVTLKMKVASRKVPDDVETIIEAALLDIGLNKTDAYNLARKGSTATIRTGAFQQLIPLNAYRAEKVLRDAKGSEKFLGRERIMDAALAVGTEKMKNYLVDSLPKSNAADQRVIVSGIGDNGLSQYENDLLELLPATEGELHIEILDTLGKVGGDASFDALYEAFLDDSRNKVIVEAVSRLNAPAADVKAVETAANSTDVAARLASLKVIELRNSPGATELCNKIAAAPGDKKLREAAFKSMEKIGNLESVKILTNLILEKDPSMRAAQLSLKRLALSYDAPDDLWEDVFRPVLEKADDEQRKGLILVLDGNPGEDALDYLRYLILFTDGELRPLALRTLARWPNHESGEVWLEILANEGLSSEDIASAMRALLRILSTDDVDGNTKSKGGLAIQIVESGLPDDFKQSCVEALDRKFKKGQQTDLEETLEPLKDDPVVGEIVQGILDKSV